MADAPLRPVPGPARPVRHHGLAGSIGLHLVIGAALATAASHLQPAEPPPTLEVELVRMSSAPALAALPSTPPPPLPVEAPPALASVPDPAVPRDPDPPLLPDQPPVAAPALPAPQMPIPESPPPPSPPAPAIGTMPLPPLELPPHRAVKRALAAPATVPRREAVAHPISAPPATTPAQLAEPVAPQPGWERLLASWLAEHRTYPEAARRRGESGDVTLRLEIAPDGRITGIAIVTSTAGDALNAAAVAVFTGATLPPPLVPVQREIRLRYRLAD